MKRTARQAFDISLRLDVVVRYLWLNVLWLGLCLTVIGAPAATTAVHAVVSEWADGDERPVFSRFVAAVRARGLRATAVGAALAGVIALIVVNMGIATLMGSWVSVALVVGLLSIAIPLGLCAAVSPMVLASPTSGFRDAARATCRYALGRPGQSLSALAVAAIIGFAALAFPPALLLLPAPATRVLVALRRGARSVPVLPRFRTERNYA